MLPENAADASLATRLPAKYHQVVGARLARACSGQNVLLGNISTVMGV